MEHRPDARRLQRRLGRGGRRQARLRRDRHGHRLLGPAAGRFNGIAGLRPSIGRVCNHGIVPLAWTLDTAGPMCRTVRDCAAMLEAMAGFDARDRQTANVPVPRYGDELARGLGGLRLAVIEDFSLTGLQPEVETALRGALAAFETAGATVREVRIADLEPSISALLTIDIAEPAAYHAAVAARASRGVRRRRALAAGGGRAVPREPLHPGPALPRRRSAIASTTCCATSTRS